VAITQPRKNSRVFTDIIALRLCQWGNLLETAELAFLLPDLIEAGVDIVQPAEITARNMEPKRLKRELGQDVVFLGWGCDTQNHPPLWDS
jgi:hypothetical protein